VLPPLSGWLLARRTPARHCAASLRLDDPDGDLIARWLDTQENGYEHGFVPVFFDWMT